MLYDVQAVKHRLRDVESDLGSDSGVQRFEASVVIVDRWIQMIEWVIGQWYRN